MQLQQMLCGLHPGNPWVMLRVRTRARVHPLHTQCTQLHARRVLPPGATLVLACARVALHWTIYLPHIAGSELRTLALLCCVIVAAPWALLRLVGAGLTSEAARNTSAVVAAAHTSATSLVPVSGNGLHHQPVPAAAPNSGHLSAASGELNKPVSSKLGSGSWIEESMCSGSAYAARTDMAAAAAVGSAGSLVCLLTEAVIHNR
jgi:hypothetical protein